MVVLAGMVAAGAPVEARDLPNRACSFRNAGVVFPSVRNVQATRTSCAIATSIAEGVQAWAAAHSNRLPSSVQPVSDGPAYRCRYQSHVYHDALGGEYMTARCTAGRRAVTMILDS